MNVRALLKKHWSTLLILIFIGLLLFPKTGMPIKVFFSKLIAFSPSEIPAEKRETLSSYAWSLENLHGQPVDFSFSEGKVVVVNVWATWCPPCVAELPSFQALVKDYEQKVDFYFVSMEELAHLNGYMNKKGYFFPVFRPLGPFPDELSTHSFPTTFVISKTGEIVIKKKGAADWNSDNVRELLDELLAE